MKLTIATFEQFYVQIKKNRWYWLFSLFCRLALSFGFIAAGYVKIIGERFANGLPDIHPMGSYLVALFNTGYYYTFIGLAQIAAGILLLIPRTVALGTLLYFPIIINIWVLSYAVRFEGSIFTAPLMTLANLFLLIWSYDRLRYILPFNKFSELEVIIPPKEYSLKFPYQFFTGVTVTTIIVIIFSQLVYDVMPRNSMLDCKKQFKDTENEIAGYNFCECVHKKGNPLNKCLNIFNASKK